jgi:TPR repeat protein
MSAALCIDFGTSSIRAVYRDEKNNRHVLPIGLVTGAKSIDEASIRSEIHIDAQGKGLKYGEHAVVAKAKLAASSYYESSPKLWLLEPDKLDQPAFTGLKVTRRELLTGLLAYGIFGAKEALQRIQVAYPEVLQDIRIAHPVWREDLSRRANQELLQIGYAASQLAEQGDWGDVPLSTLRSYFDQPYTGSLHPRSDVIEPVAAALELLSRKVNLRQICAVVDVGAGTTDIGLFYSVVTEGHADRLIPLSTTRSVFKAGNEIDQVLYQILAKKSGTTDKLKLYDVRTRIRQIKEFLFANGFVQELGVRVSLDEVERHSDIIKMAQEIRACFEEAVLSDRKKILGLNRDPRIQIVMAGGGGNVSFIRSVLSRPVAVGEKLIPVSISASEGTDQLTYGASHERLAVALGGANVYYDSLRHEHEKLTSIPSLGYAKQDVTRSFQTIELSTSALTTPALPAQAIKSDLTQIAKASQEKALWRAKISSLARIAETGNIEAQFEIAEQLSSTASQYVLEAMDWYVRAARQGHLASQLKLVDLLLSGTAIAQDYPDAYFWLLVAARNGSKDSLEQAKTVRPFLPASVAEKIQIDAISWQPKSETAAHYFSHKIAQQTSPPRRLESKSQGKPQSKNLHPKQQPQVVINPFDELKIRELIRYSGFLKIPTSSINDMTELAKWSKKKEPFESVFLAMYCDLQFDASAHLSEELQRKLDAWLSFCKRRRL